MSKVIMQENKVCFLCGRNGFHDPLERHHIYGGAYRNKSEKYGMVVLLCGSRCHRNGENAAHKSKAVKDYLRAQGQRAAMEQLGWTKEEFIREFGRSYI